MKLAFVAPEICTPFTEGRKRFVVDLIDEIKEKNDLVLLTTTLANETSDLPCKVYTTTCQKPSQHLIKIITRLQKILKTERPDVVCLFPYGTFRHIYGLASKAFIWLVNLVCSFYNIPCITLMYSIENTSVSSLKRYAKNLAISSSQPGTLQINTGIKIQCHDSLNNDDNIETRKILFMAGMWQKTIQRIEHVINIRGLGILLRAGRMLAEHDIKLIIAVPLFSSLECQQFLLTHPDNTWPTDAIIFQAEVCIPDIFCECDLFVFPYNEEIVQFTPTSVLEAMSAGKCVALTDRDFVSPLINNGKTAITISPDDSVLAANQILDILNNKKKRRSIEKAAYQLVKDKWSIKLSASQLLKHANELTGSKSTYY